MALSTSTLTKVLRELRDLQNNPIDGVKILINEDDVTEIGAEYEGPAGTPFEGGIFRMRLVLGPEFPSAAPRGQFVTKIFHPNVSDQGEICVNTLKRDWTPDTDLRRIFTVIRCLLVEPNPESALNEDAGRLLLDGFEAFATRARIYTDIHARRPSVLGASKDRNGVADKASGAKAPGTKTAKAAKAVPKPAAKRGLKRL